MVWTVLLPHRWRMAILSPSQAASARSLNQTIPCTTWRRWAVGGRGGVEARFLRKAANSKAANCNRDGKLQCCKLQGCNQQGCKLQAGWQTARLQAAPTKSVRYRLAHRPPPPLLSDLSVVQLAGEKPLAPAEELPTVPTVRHCRQSGGCSGLRVSYKHVSSSTKSVLIGMDTIGSLHRLVGPRARRGPPDEVAGSWR